MTAMHVLITGAGGHVGQLLTPQLVHDHRLRLTDLHLPATTIAPLAGPRAEVVLGNLSEPQVAARAVNGVDAVVHLAGNPHPDSTWEQLRRPNLDLVVTLLRAATLAGVKRLVLASSVHALGGYRRHTAPGKPLITDDLPPYPCCPYGATKVFAEAAGRVTADSTSMSVICLRLGGCQPSPADTDAPDLWLGPDDLARAVRRALTADIRFGAYTVTSHNSNGTFDLDAAQQDLGYLPIQNSDTHLST